MQKQCPRIFDVFCKKGACTDDNLAHNEKKIEQHKQKYRAAWNALRVLVGEESVNARQLLDKDVTSLDEVDTRAYRNARKVLKELGKQKKDQEGKELPVIRPGESKKQTSWIWKSVKPDDEPEALTEAVRLEWVKTWACKRRWDEEVELLHEEIRRVCASLQYEASRWRSFVTADLDFPGAEGRIAYSLRQASIRDRLVDKFKAIWDSPDPKPRGRGSSQDASTGDDADEEEVHDSESDKGHGEYFSDDGEED